MATRHRFMPASATQIVVERQLEQNNISRYDLEGEKFIDKVWEWKEESGGK